MKYKSYFPKNKSNFLCHINWLQFTSYHVYYWYSLLQRPPSPSVQNSYHRRFWGALDLTRW